jgi:hypothetical protein
MQRNELARGHLWLLAFMAFRVAATGFLVVALAVDHVVDAGSGLRSHIFNLQLVRTAVARRGSIVGLDVHRGEPFGDNVSL